MRQAMIRFKRRINASVTVAIAAENPTPQFADARRADRFGRAPRCPTFRALSATSAAAGTCRWPALSGSFASIRRGDDRRRRAPPAGASTRRSSLPVGRRDQLLAQFAIGEGTARYIEGAERAEPRRGAVADRRVERLSARRRATSAYMHVWKPGLKSGCRISTAYVDDDAGLAATTIERVHGHARKSVLDAVSSGRLRRRAAVGPARRTGTAADGDAWRFQFAVIYRLN